jgi:hypothetical protein
MALPGVEIIVENGALGRAATTSDGVAALIVVGMSKTDLPLYTPKQIFSLTEAEALGLTQAADVTDKVDTWLQIKEFYDEAGNGAELWIMTVPLTRTMTELLDPTVTINSARKLLDYAQGRIRLLGISRFVESTLTYAQVTQGGIDEDVHTALPKGNALALEYRNEFKPFSILIDGRGWNGVVADLTDLRTYNFPKCSVVLSTSQPSKTAASVGLVLGRAAKLPVQRNIGRVKDGTLNVSKLYYTNGGNIEDFSGAQIEAIHDKGYITPRTYVGRTGYFLADDPTATLATDDYLTIANNRVIDKALVIAYSTYVNEINDEILIDETGKLELTQVAYLEQILRNVLNINMVSQSEVSAVEVYIDPAQNVLSTDRLDIVLRITPVGYLKSIVVSLGFRNPGVGA